MANNINYRGDISNDCSWLHFKEADGIVVSNNGKSMETSELIPTVLDFIMDPNASKEKRQTDVKFTLVNGDSLTVTVYQNGNKSGIDPIGNPVFDKAKSSISIIPQGEQHVDARAHTVQFQCELEAVYNQQYQIKDCDGIVTATTTSSSTSSLTVTNDNLTTWAVTEGGIYSATCANGKLQILKNNAAVERKYKVAATYNGLYATSDYVIQNPANVEWLFKIVTNMSGVTAHFISGETGTTDIATGNCVSSGSSIYSYTYKISADTAPDIWGYVTKDSVDKSMFVLLSGSTPSVIMTTSGYGGYYNASTVVDNTSGETSINIKSYDYKLIYIPDDWEEPKNGDGMTANDKMDMNEGDSTLVINLKEYDESKKIEEQLLKGNDEKV